MTTSTPPTAPVTVYEPSAPGTPPLRPYLRALVARRPLIWHLARTELKAEHYDTFLGQLWLVLEPMLMASVYLLVRAVIRPVGTPDQMAAIIDHLIMGVFFFQFAASVMNSSARSIIGNKQMILNTSFPRAVFPVAATLKAGLDFIPVFVVFLVVHALLGQPFTPYLLLLPPLLLVQMALSFGAGLFFAALSVYVPDVINFLRYFLRLWLFATPVLYTVSEIPENMKAILRWNPLYPFFGAYEQIGDGFAPAPVYLVAAMAWTVGFVVLGTVIFLRRERNFATRF